MNNIHKQTKNITSVKNVREHITRSNKQTFSYVPKYVAINTKDLARDNDQPLSQLICRGAAYSEQITFPQVEQQRELLEQEVLNSTEVLGSQQFLDTFCAKILDKELNYWINIYNQFSLETSESKSQNIYKYIAKSFEYMDNLNISFDQSSIDVIKQNETTQNINSSSSNSSAYKQNLVEKIKEIERISNLVKNTQYLELKNKLSCSNLNSTTQIIRKLSVPQVLKFNREPEIKGLDLNTTIVNNGDFTFTFNITNNKNVQAIPTQYQGKVIQEDVLSTPLNSDYCLLFSICVALDNMETQSIIPFYIQNEREVTFRPLLNNQPVTLHTILYQLYQLYRKNQIEKHLEAPLIDLLIQFLNSVLNVHTNGKFPTVATVLKSVDQITSKNWKVSLAQGVQLLEILNLNFVVCNKNTNKNPVLNKTILIIDVDTQYHAVVITTNKYQIHNIPNKTTFFSVLLENQMITDQLKNDMIDCLEQDRKRTGNPRNEVNQSEAKLLLVQVIPDHTKTSFFGIQMKPTKKGEQIGFHLFFQVPNEKICTSIIYLSNEEGAFKWKYTPRPVNTHYDNQNLTLKYSKKESTDEKEKRFQQEREINKAIKNSQPKNSLHNQLNISSIPQSQNQQIHDQQSDYFTPEEWADYSQQYYQSQQQYEYQEQGQEQQVANNAPKYSYNYNFDTVKSETKADNTNKNFIQSDIKQKTESINHVHNQSKSENQNTIISNITSKQNNYTFEQQQLMNKINFNNAKMQVEIKNGEEFIDLEQIKIDREVLKLCKESEIYKYHTRATQQKYNFHVYQFLSSFQVIDKKLCNIALNLKFGLTGTEEIKKQYPIEYAIQKMENKLIQNYGHPFLRWTVDFLTAQLFTKISSEVVVEIAGKIHKNIRISPQTKFINFRPTLNGYDSLYWEHHEELINQLTANNQLLMIDEKISKKINIENYIQNLNINQNVHIINQYNQQKIKTIISIDSIYYPGVRDGITQFLKENIKSKAFLIFSVYKQECGKYIYSDNEGHFEIYIENNEYWVNNKPKDNQTPYKHKLQSWPLKEMFAGLDHNNIYWSEINYINTSPYSKTVLVELSNFATGEFDQKSDVLKDATPKAPISKLKKFTNNVFNKIIGKDEELVEQIAKLQNIDWTLYDEEAYNMALLYYQTLETEEIQKSGHFARCQRAILINKGLVKLSASVGESYFDRLHYNITRAYIKHMVYRGKFKKLTLAFKDMVEINWQELFINHKNLYLLLFGAGTLALSSVVPVAPIAVGLKVAASSSFLGTLKDSVVALGKKVLNTNPIIPEMKHVIKSDIISGGSKMFANAMVQPKMMETIYHNVEEYTIEPKNKVIEWKEKNKQELLQSDHPNLYNESLFKSDPKQIKQFLHEFVSKKEDDYKTQTKNTIIEKQYQHAGYKYDEICSNQSRARLQRKNNTNMLWALFKRQIGHINKPDKKVVEDYTRYLNSHAYPLWKETIDQHDYKPITLQDILDKKPSGKKELYKRAHEKFKQDQIFENEMEIMMKGDEYQYNDDGKPRILANPSDIGKCYGSYIVTAMQKILLECYPEICIGLNTEQLQDKLTKDLQSVDDAVVLVYDHSNHDAHQYPFLKQKCEMQFVEMCYDRVFQQCVDIPFYAKDKLKEFITAVSMKVFFRHPETGKKIKGELLNVTSGHPISTTKGNNIRVMTYINYIKHMAKIPSNKIKINISGDDVIIFINRHYERIFRKWFGKIYLFDEKQGKPHGLGQLVKGGELKVSEVAIDFLSKLGVILPTKEIILNRQIERGLISGNVTKKINKNFTKEDYNWAITTNLESWGFSVPVIKKYISERKATLGHTLSKRINSLKNALRLTSDIEYVQHKNSYDMTGKEEFFHHIYNPIVISQMESKISQAPLYLSKLKVN